jgi:hypothetical protein
MSGQSFWRRLPVCLAFRVTTWVLTLEVIVENCSSPLFVEPTLSSVGGEASPASLSRSPYWPHVWMRLAGLSGCAVILLVRIMTLVVTVLRTF